MSRGSAFTQIPRRKLGRNYFELSHAHKTSLKMGYLYPVTVFEVEPGTNFKFSMETFVKAAPMIAPLMDELNIRVDTFFVPFRILWSQWDRHLAGELINQAPYIEFGDEASKTPNPGSIAQFLGYPVKPTNTAFATQQKALIFRLAAYNFIWNEWYRSDSLQEELPRSLVADSNAYLLDQFIGLPQRRAWQHDYFTSALPYPAGNNTDVHIPITHRQANVQVRNANNGNVITSNEPTKAGADGTFQVGASTRAYLDHAHDATINDLRRAVRTQEFLERLGIGGRRTREIIYSMFGVDNGDARFQIPELLGTHTQRMVISEVLSTAQTEDSQGAVKNPVGNYAGHGVSSGMSSYVNHTAREHGIVMCILNIQPPPSYASQGLHRDLTRFNQLDLVWPDFANISEQAVLNKEIYADSATPEDTFGYQPQYSERRFINNRVTGDMVDTLKFWHLANIYDSQPVLGPGFIECDPRTDIFAVPDKNLDKFYVQMYNHIKTTQSLPKFGTPRL